MKNLEKEREQKNLFFRDWQCGTRIGAGMTMPTTFWVTFRWSGLKFFGFELM
jgi:hypothetical protein